MRIAPRKIFFSKKAAINLSVEFLVVIVISLVILGMGVTLLYKFLGGAEDIKAELDKKTEDELRRLLIDEGKKVALPLHLAELSPGERHIFGLGILNVENEEKSFFMRVEGVKAADQENHPFVLELREVETWLLYSQLAINLKKGENHFEPLMVEVPKKDVKKGTYIFDLVVRKDDLNPITGVRVQYGNTQKFIVVVK